MDSIKKNTVEATMEMEMIQKVMATASEGQRKPWFWRMASKLRRVQARSKLKNTSKLNRNGPGIFHRATKDCQCTIWKLIFLAIATGASRCAFAPANAKIHRVIGPSAREELSLNSTSYILRITSYLLGSTSSS